MIKKIWVGKQKHYADGKMNSVSHGGSMDTVLFSLLVDIVNHDDVQGGP